jgi:hypothetical protein
MMTISKVIRKPIADYSTDALSESETKSSSSEPIKVEEPKEEWRRMAVDMYVRLEHDGAVDLAEYTKKFGDNEVEKAVNYLFEKDPRVFRVTRGKNRCLILE